MIVKCSLEEAVVNTKKIKEKLAGKQVKSLNILAQISP